MAAVVWQYKAYLYLYCRLPVSPVHLYYTMELNKWTPELSGFCCMSVCVLLCVWCVVPCMGPYLKALFTLWLIRPSVLISPSCSSPRCLLPTHFHMWPDKIHILTERQSWVTHSVNWLILFVFFFIHFSLCPLVFPPHLSFPLFRAVVEKYLLEKSRLVSREKNERWGETGRVLTHWPPLTFMGPFVQTWGVSLQEPLTVGFEVQLTAAVFSLNTCSPIYTHTHTMLLSDSILLSPYFCLCHESILLVSLHKKILNLVVFRISFTKYSFIWLVIPVLSELKMTLLHKQMTKGKKRIPLLSVTSERHRLTGHVVT